MRPEAAEAAEAACLHCGLQVPAGLTDYCCAGCRTVHAALNEWGLADGWIQRLREADARPRPARPTGRKYEEFDDPALLAACGEIREGRGRAELYLEGVHCSACAWLVERLPKILPGVESARLDLTRGVAELRWDSTRVSLSAAARALDRLGYPPHPARCGETEIRRAEERRELIRIGVAGALAGNLMGIAFALYGGSLHSIEPGFQAFFRWTSCALATVALAWPGRGFLRGGWNALRTRTPHADLPIALGLLAGYLGGAWNTWRGEGEVYFEAVGTLVFLLLVGRFLQRRQQRRAHDALALLHALAPAVARLVDDGGNVREVPVSALRAGDRVEVRAGEGVPADGRILEGRSGFDLSLLTGESQPVELQPGAAVHAGTTSLSARIIMKVERTGAATRVGRIADLVARAASERAPIVLFADRMAGWFTAAVLAIALGTAAYWSSQGPAIALDRAMALLLVACPCALGMATPLALTAAIGRAARRGFLVKSGAALEGLAHPGILFLDKTGTLTEGHFALRAWSGTAETARLAAALEGQTAGPHAAALRALAPMDPAAMPVTGLRFTPGRGVEGEVAGRQVLAGSPAFAAAHGAPVPEALLEAALARGRTPVAVLVDGRFAGLAELGDALRPGAAEMVNNLQSRGWDLRILSGDHPRVVAAVARELGIPAAKAQGNASPEDKVAALAAARAESQRGAIVMVGDGVNDAAALAAADVGVAARGGAEASLQAADVHLGGEEGLSALSDLLAGARRTVTAVHRALLVSLLYNAAAVALAATGLISPILAAILMPVSSLTVVALAFRARTFTPAAA
jgi:Cu2+-exporting ATPase